MRNKSKLAAFALLSFAMFAAFACGEAAKPTANVANNDAATAPANVTRPSPNRDEHKIDEAPRISIEEAKRDFDKKAAVFIDTHPADHFENEHIPGAINIQPNVIKQNLDKVPKGKKIIVYCS